MRCARQGDDSNNESPAPQLGGAGLSLCGDESGERGQLKVQAGEVHRGLGRPVVLH